MNAARPSILISSIGWLNVLIGLVFVGFGVYVLFAGADAVAALFQMQTDGDKAANMVAGKEHAEQAKEGAGIFAKGLSGVILAFAFVIGGCSIAQGLPNMLVGVGVILRSNVARIFAIVFAVLAVLEGLACLSAIWQSSRFLYASLFLLAYAIVTFFTLLGRRASLEFSGGLQQATESSEPGKSETMSTVKPTTAPSVAPRRPKEAVLLVLVLAMTATTAVFATLYFTRTTPTSDLSQNPVPKGESKPSIDDVKSMVKHQPKLAAFHEAVLDGNVPRAAELLKDVDVDQPDAEGRTALMKAADRGNLRAAMFLIAMGAQFNQRDKEGKTALMHAVEKNQTGIIEIFRGEGTVPAEMADLRAKHHDASKGKFELPKLNYLVSDNRGRTAFMQAMVKGHLKAAEKMSYRPVPGGATPDHTRDLEDGEGNTILHILAADGNTSLVRLFKWGTGNLEDGWYFDLAGLPVRSSKLNQANRAGRTAWMLAAEKGHLDIVKHLLPNPPRDDLQLKDKAGKTGLDLARANNHKEVVAYLTKLQQDLPAKGAAKDKK